MSTAKDFTKAIQDAVTSKTSAYDTTAEVMRVEGSTVWVHIPGGVDETPVKRTIDAKVGDTVQVRVGGGSAWLVGNASAPPTDDTTAVKATEIAVEASRSATDYVTDLKDGVFVHPSGDDTSGWKIAEAIELLKHGVSYIWAGLLNGLATIRIGRTDSGHTNINSAGMRVYGADGTTELANIGYGAGTNSGGGTSDAPYFTFGTRKTTTSVYDAGQTYKVGDLCLYGNPQKMYVCVYDITTPESWNASHWKYYIGNYSMAEGYNIIASGIYSHAEGGYANASGSFSHAEGEEAIANGGSSHAEGFKTTASGASSHAEGVGTIANGTSSHAEGFSTTTSGGSSHAEGYNTTAIGTYSHAQNEGTITSRDAQTSVGTYNVEDTAATTTHPNGMVYYGQHAVIIGNGTDDNTRSNATAIQWDGTARLAGDVYVGCNADSTGGYRLPIVQSGHLGGASVSANSYLDRTVTFDKAFPSAPTVVCSIASTATAGALGSFSVSANSITTTGFTARVFNASSGSRTPGVDWIAVY